MVSQVTTYVFHNSIVVTNITLVLSTHKYMINYYTLYCKKYGFNLYVIKDVRTYHIPCGSLNLILHKLCTYNLKFDELLHQKRYNLQTGIISIYVCTLFSVQAAVITACATWLKRQNNPASNIITIQRRTCRNVCQ